MKGKQLVYTGVHPIRIFIEEFEPNDPKAQVHLYTADGQHKMIQCATPREANFVNRLFGKLHEVSPFPGRAMVQSYVSTPTILTAAEVDALFPDSEEAGDGVEE